MTTLYLNAKDGSQVQSPQVVAVLSAEPNVWLLIYSGIAVQRQRAKGSTGFLGIDSSTSTTEATVNVTLDNISGILLQYAATASMSNIVEENTWGQWTIDSTSLALRDNGDLVLTANTSVTGEGDAEFWSFYYHVDAKVVLDEASISGAIRWAKSLTAPLTVPHFAITAKSQIPQGPNEFPIPRVEATGLEGAVNSDDPIFYHVPYRITGPLLGKEVTVSVDAIQASFTGVGQLAAGQISGAHQITLIATNRHATEINFELSRVRGPS